MTRRKQRGGTLVEAAFVVLLFMLLLIGIIEFARAYNVYQTATNAAREGARFGIAPCPFNSDKTVSGTCAATYGANQTPSVSAIQDKVNTFLKAANINLPDNSYIKVCGYRLGCTASDFKDSTQLPCTADPYSNGTCFLAVKVTVPYSPIFFTQFASQSASCAGGGKCLLLNTESKMREECQNCLCPSGNPPDATTHVCS